MTNRDMEIRKILIIIAATMVYTALTMLPMKLIENWNIIAVFLLVANLGVAFGMYYVFNDMKLKYSTSERGLFLMKFMKKLGDKVDWRKEHVRELKIDVINCIRQHCDFVEKTACDMHFHDADVMIITLSWKEHGEVQTKLFRFDLKIGKCREYLDDYEVSTIPPEAEEVEPPVIAEND